MNLALLDLGDDAAALCISQFTLYGDVRRGLRPSFTEAARPEVGGTLYELLFQVSEALGVTGRPGPIRCPDVRCAVETKGPSLCWWKRDRSALKTAFQRPRGHWAPRYTGFRHI